MAMSNIDCELPEGKSVNEQLEALLKKELKRAGATPRAVDLFVKVRGLSDGPPTSLRKTDVQISGEWVRRLVAELEEGPLKRLIYDESKRVRLLKGSVESVVGLIERLAPSSCDAMCALIAKQAGINVPHPAAIVRLADILGIHHKVRITKWSARAKFLDDGGSELATSTSRPRMATAESIVPASMPEIFSGFINAARKIYRVTGAVPLIEVADWVSMARGVPVSSIEAKAMLEPFATHLGRHDGDDWFAFMNSPNDFLKKVQLRLDIIGTCSLDELCVHYRNYTRSYFINRVKPYPRSVLVSLLELAGYEVRDDTVQPRKSAPQSDASDAAVVARDTRDFLRKIFVVAQQKHGRSKSGGMVHHSAMVQEMIAAGISESAAFVYLTNTGYFKSYRNLCKFNESWSLLKVAKA